MGKLKIPSIFLRVISGPFKGYDAEFVSRYSRGEIIAIRIIATGNQIVVPITYVVFFIRTENKIYKYINIQNGYSLRELKSVDDLIGTQIAIIEEESDSPSRYSPIFIPNPDDMLVENIEVELYKMTIEPSKDEDNMDIDISKNGGDYVEEYNQEHEEEAHFVPGTYSQEFIESQYIVLDNHPISVFLKDFYSILGYNHNNSFINAHSLNLQSILSKEPLNRIAYNNDIYKKFIVSYVFIYINNLGIGYNISAYCKDNFTSNDDPKYVKCVSLKSKFIDNDWDPYEYINFLLEGMDTSIVPIPNVSSYISTPRKTILLTPIKKNTIDSKIKFMKFPLILDEELNLITLKIKQEVIDKIDKDLLLMNKNRYTKSIIKNFIKNFDDYNSGNRYKILHTNSNSTESKLILPYLKMYRQLIEVEKDKFYDKPIKTVINNSEIKYNKYTSIKIQLMNDFKNEIINKINNPKISKSLKYAYEYVYENFKTIINLYSSDIKKIKIYYNIESDENEKEKYDMILKVYFTFSELLKNKITEFDKLNIRHEINIEKELYSKRKTNITENYKVNKKSRVNVIL